MIEADAFIKAARGQGLDFYTGVPCSFLKPLINGVISHPDTDYVGATSEGEAVAIGVGGWLAGRDSVVMCQNSGLGNTVNPLTSLAWPFRVPLLLVVTHRGAPGLKDEPQHELMGQITGRLLEDIDVPHRPFPDDPACVVTTLEETCALMRQRSRPVAYIMQKGDVAGDALNERAVAAQPAGSLADLRTGGARPTRFEVLERTLDALSEEAAIIASTGYCGRELFTIADRDQHFYQVGSMGCASAIGLGVAVNAARPVVVLDGDGAALMKLGNLATIGARRPENLIHVVLDNGVHESTGGQATVSPAVDFAAVAVACGYVSGSTVDSLAGFDDAFGDALARPGPHLIRVELQPGTRKELGRPTIAPHEVAARFRNFVCG